MDAAEREKKLKEAWDSFLEKHKDGQFEIVVRLKDGKGVKGTCDVKQVPELNKFGIDPLYALFNELCSQLVVDYDSTPEDGEKDS